MRLEQLVLYRPGDDDRVRFGRGLTIFSGLDTTHRDELIETIAQALTGALPSTSVIYTDREGRRVFADRTGATFADSGARAPAPNELLGRDPDVVARLISLHAADLGLDQESSAAQIRAQLAQAKTSLEELHANHLAVMERDRQIQEWRSELADLDQRIATADEDAARWVWAEHRRQLDEARAELAMVDAGAHEADAELLESVEGLRTAGAEWADLAAEASELSSRLGALPEVSAEGLERVAATPDEPPSGFAGRLEAWRTAADADRAARAALAEATAPVPAADPLVQFFAELDQTRLWAAYDELTRSRSAYASASSNASAEGSEDDLERAVEQAHLEVVRAQRRVERRFVPGALGVGLLAVLALLLGNSVSIVLGPVLLAAAVAVGYLMIVAPRKHLAAAEQHEDEALSHTDASSWLGLHLRRLDAVTDAIDRKRFEVAANNQVAALVDWEEIAGAHPIDELAARADAVRAHAEAIQPKALASRRAKTQAHADATAAAERSAHLALASGLEAFGISAEMGTNLDPEELVVLLGRRIEAGRLARDASRLRSLQARERDAAHRLDELLLGLGFDGDDLESRLERCIQAVTAARQRHAVSTGERTRARIEADIDRLDAVVRSTRRPGWDTMPDPVRAPVDPDLLEARRREVSELVVAAGRPDVVGAERDYQIGLARVSDLEARIEGLEGSLTLAERLTNRLRRMSAPGVADESVPVLLDDPFASLSTDAQLDLMDELVALSRSYQIVLMSDQPLVARWGRSRAGQDSVTLFEVEPDERDVRAVVLDERVTA